MEASLSLAFQKCLNKELRLTCYPDGIAKEIRSYSHDLNKILVMELNHLTSPIVKGDVATVGVFYVLKCVEDCDDIQQDL
jgi:hypothetical protein